MLKEFKVKNFMNFQDELFFSLANDKKYDFNNHIIENKIIKDAVIVGNNATGKSNFGKAILDIANHLTDNYKTNVPEGLYTNLYSKDPEAHFTYTFQFGNHSVRYKYDKSSATVVTRESLSIDGREVIKNSNSLIFVKLKGAEHLNLEKVNMKISLVKYVHANTVLDMRDEENKVFADFMEFIQGMLFAMNTEQVVYAGFSNVSGSLQKLICDLENGVEELQMFLSEMGIQYELVSKDDLNGKNIYCRFGEKEIPLHAVSSSGTRSLTGFFYWYKQKKNIKFMYLDEFDAFYHTNLAKKVLDKLIALDGVQVVVSTHNTDIITNEILRPDCYYELCENDIKPFYKKTSKSLREAHNLQKMFKAGAFNE